MLFKNAVVYRLTKPLAISLEELEDKLSEKTFTPCGSPDLYKMGWTTPLGRSSNQLVHVTDGKWMLCLKREDKVLPASAINGLVDEKVFEIESAQDRKVRKKEKDEIKEEIIQEKLPGALVKSSKTYVYISPKENLVIVNASNNKKAEEITSFIRKTIGSLPIRTLSVKLAPNSVMTSWATDKQNAPEGVITLDEWDLRNPGEEGGTIRCKGVDIDEIHTHIENGMQVSKAALEWEEKVSFLLHEDLTIKRIKFHDIINDRIDDASDDAASKFDASFAIMSGEFSLLIPLLLGGFGGEDLS